MLVSVSKHCRALPFAKHWASHVSQLSICLFSGYFKDNILLHFVASMISGLVTTGCSMPVDIVKTRFVLFSFLNVHLNYCCHVVTCIQIDDIEFKLVVLMFMC